ncbi:MAG: phospholipid/cholesterol/gamma-HCH transport system substrate-binding protein [Chthoniobacter sp.]|jgi:ABC-type transporter Mla subunit MlaD|nr:phospholipid/cholesterol/gamma-HCH transport system substrate-binding protein [Chthoniobacter sp.]
MDIRREEIRTGLLVVVSVAILTAVLLALGAPGVFKAVNHYNIFFDNAGGIKQGAPVLLAGRKIGQVTKLNSPVPLQDRPKAFPKYEAVIEVTVDRGTKIFREVNVRMVQYSLLGEQVIDFANGDESSGIASNGAYFVGERQKDFAASISEAVDVIKNVVTPVAQEAQKTMVELQSTANNLKTMTAPGSNIDQAVVNFRNFGQNLVELSGSTGKLQTTIEHIAELTGPDSHLQSTLQNADKFTSDLAKNKDIGASLNNFRQASEQLRSTMSTLGPQFQSIGQNLQEATDTVKRQPWRLVWPSTKTYPASSNSGPRLNVPQPVKQPARRVRD